MNAAKLTPLFLIAGMILQGCGQSPGLAVGDKDTPTTLDPVAAYFFSSDTRTESVDGIDGLNPILSTAPPDCRTGQAGATASNEMPECGDMKSLSYNAGGPDTMIRATVFVPEHQPGETFPVILHSHGWGDSRASTPRDGSESLYVYFGEVEAMLTEYWNNGYVVVSFDERGWGESEGDVMVMSPYHETRDARAVLDWVVELAKNGDIPVDIDTANGDDLTIGLFGSSYGGGFQFPLAATDSRIDTLIANGTWHSLLESTIPNDAVKATWINLLCVASAQQQNRHDHLTNVCTTVLSPTTKTGADLDAGRGIIEFMANNGVDYHQQLIDAGNGFHDEDPAYTQRPIDVLLIQGMTDGLFNHTQALDNYRYFKAAGGDVRVLSNQAGHMNIARQQVEGGRMCGTIDPLRASRIWFDAKLKGIASAQTALADVPEMCLSLDESTALLLDGVPGRDTALDAALGINTTATAFSFNINTLATADFQSVFTVPTNETDWVLAGVPRLSSFEVQTGVAYLGVVIQRNGEDILVDEQPSGYNSQVWGNQEMVSVAEKLLPGDVVGIQAFQIQAEYVLTAVAPTPTPDVNSYTASGNVVLPLFRVPDNSPMLSTATD